MGYQEPERLGVIAFDSPPFEGAEVTVRENVGLGVFQELERLGTTPADTPTAEKVAAWERLCEVFGTEVLRDWNVTGPDDEPRPANAEGCRLVSAEFLSTVAALYLAGIRQAPPPLPSGSARSKPPLPPGTRKRGKTPRRGGSKRA